MTDYSELKRLAEALIQHASDSYYLPCTIAYERAASPATVLALIAEVEALRSQVDTLQSDVNSWQSGYDEGRRMGTKTALDEREELRKDADRYKWLSAEGNWVARMFGKWRAHVGEYGDSAPTEWHDTREEAIDAAMSKGVKTK